MFGLLDRMKTWFFPEDDYGAPPPGEDEEMAPVPRRREPVIRFHSRSGEIFIRRPRNQDEARICVDCLRGRRAVVVNLKQVQPDHALRVFDFLAGAAYALGGQLEQAGEGVYLVTPHNIAIMAEDEAAPASSRSDFWQEI